MAVLITAPGIHASSQPNRLVGVEIREDDAIDRVSSPELALEGHLKILEPKPLGKSSAIPSPASDQPEILEMDF